jgi:hypothetical protein
MHPDDWESYASGSLFFVGNLGEKLFNLGGDTPHPTGLYLGQVDAP